MQREDELLATISMMDNLNKKLDVQNKVLNEAVQVAVFDDRMRFVEANTNYCKCLGHSFHDLKGQSLIDFLAREGGVEKSKSIEAAVAKREHWSGELVYGRSDNRKVYVQASLMPFISELGDIKVYAVQLDVSASRYKNIELHRQNEELFKLNQLKNKLFSIVSHDFRSPLKSLQGTLQLALQGAVTTEELKSHTEAILTRVNRTSEFLDNLLNWARGQMTGAKIKFDKIDIKVLADEIIELILPQAEKKQIQVLNKIDHEWVIADREMLKLVVRNLLSNAIKFTNEGGKVELYGESSNNTYCIAVSDNGVGMSKEQVDQLFQLEHYSTMGTADEMGVGLGLILSRDFIIKNRGEIWVKSDKDKGTTIYFTLQKSKDRQLIINPAKKSVIN